MVLHLWMVVSVVLTSQEPAFEPTSHYTLQAVQGWSVHVNNRLLSERTELAQQALKLLDVKLFDINRVVPESALSRLHEVPIWLELDDDKRDPCACYHPSRDWRADNGVNPEKGLSVEITRADIFLRWSLDQPWMILHELAHAYHHRVVGWDDARVMATLAKARENGNYESVLHTSGEMRKAYALGNPQEYFAELSEAYFGTNDFFPFVRAELNHHDPEGAALMRELWGLGGGD
ncbi:MAG: hypothetical protein AB1486_34585 [Planctomycetota bacterium]